MARKNPFENLMQKSTDVDEPVKQDYTIKGASRSFVDSIDELANRAEKLLEGETIVDLDPALIDASFLKDRIDHQEGFEEFLIAIKERGQDSPILVRPHPSKPGSYMVVFGHRRLQAARELGRNVRAVVKDVDDRDHVIAQGQENSGRADLSFIEKALFANQIVNQSFDTDNATAMAALSIDRATLSKLLSVANLPDDILEAIGAAKAIGRDRWYQLKLLLEKPSNLKIALNEIQQSGFRELKSDQRFNHLYEILKAEKRPKKSQTARAKKWVSAENDLAANLKQSGRNFTIAISSKTTDGVKFGEYISANLEKLYKEFKQESQT